MWDRLPVVWPKCPLSCLKESITRFPWQTSFRISSSWPTFPSLFDTSPAQSHSRLKHWKGCCPFSGATTSMEVMISPRCRRRANRPVSISWTSFSMPNALYWPPSIILTRTFPDTAKRIKKSVRMSWSKKKFSLPFWKEIKIKSWFWIRWWKRRTKAAKLKKNITETSSRDSTLPGVQKKEVQKWS